MARAVRYESGREEVWVSGDILEEGDYAQTLDHESSHLRTWRDFGTHVHMHGRQWRKSCREMASALAACEETR
ncbi:SprT-like domain-containing protein [Henriciella sp.]|uniref:SprT-like domain-containing protein n=1 Tax=Henriciella sp. TaxID=1968823 RepID=UPI003450B820